MSSATAFGRDNGALLDALDNLTEGERSTQQTLDLQLKGGVDQYGVLLSLIQQYGLTARIVIENESVENGQILTVSLPRGASSPVHIG